MQSRSMVNKSIIGLYGNKVNPAISMSYQVIGDASK